MQPGCSGEKHFYRHASHEQSGAVLGGRLKRDSSNPGLCVAKSGSKARGEVWKGSVQGSKEPRWEGGQGWRHKEAGSEENGIMRGVRALNGMQRLEKRGQAAWKTALAACASTARHACLRIGKLRTL